MLCWVTFIAAKYKYKIEPWSNTVKCTFQYILTYGNIISAESWRPFVVENADV